jgi:hypothetical protein
MNGGVGGATAHERSLAADERLRAAAGCADNGGLSKGETAMSAAGHIDPSNKKIALVIALLALVLAVAETLGKGAQTAAIGHNIEASNLWAFFQAKTIRMTTLRTAAEAAPLAAPAGPALEKQVEAWQKTAARYESEPETNEGRRELAARAKAAEERRDRSLAAYHQFELASAAVQVGIVLASAAIITTVMALAWIGGALGIVGLGFTLVGLLAPTAVHFF